MPDDVSQYSAHFMACLQFTIPHEGTKFENDPQDPGGATKFGVTLNELRDFHKNPHLGPDDVAALTLEDVYPIYYQDYWNKMRCGELPVGVDLIVFDYGVNAGPVRSIKFLQEAVHVNADGVLGDETMRALWGVNNIIDTIEALTDEEADYYKSLPTFPRFGNGWLSRVKDRRNTATLMATAADGQAATS